MIDEAFCTRDNVKISRKGAHAMLLAAEAAASALGVPQCIAVVDEGGHLLAFSRMDGARVGSIPIALTKAVSAATRLRSTHEEAGGDVQAAIRLALASDNRVTGIGGGFPILIEGRVAGGIGVSSGTIDEDMAVARAGLAALGSAT